MIERRWIPVCTILAVTVCQVGGVRALPPNTETLTATAPNGGSVTVVVPRSAIDRAELGIIVNTSDPQSVAVGQYYQSARGIPAENIINVSFSPGSNIMSQATFDAVKAEVDAASSPDIQAFAITWTAPWRVECMSLTTAFALGFSTDYCSAPCSSTKASAYFRSDSVMPYTDHGLRPAMVLGGTSSENVFELIDRSILSDRSFPTREGYCLRTTDTARSVRWGDMASAVDTWNQPSRLGMTYIDNSQGTSSGNYIEYVGNVLFYFTGLASVPQYATNTYVPGAVADHLTSFGGQLTNAGGQMSILRWLEAGASASYGTVVEPCNYTAKFPRVSVLMPAYFGGGTVIEAYWKSVNWPGEGIFVGDPLTRPYGTRATLDDAGVLELYTTILKPGVSYSLLAASNVDGPFTTVQSNIAVAEPTFATITQAAESAVYALVEQGADDVPPTSAIVSHVSGDVITGDVLIEADAWDDGDIMSVDLYVDGQLFASDKASPYSWVFDTTLLADGWHAFRTRAHDLSGNWGDSPTIDLEVDNWPCDNDGVCEVDEDCSTCAADCFAGAGGFCGDGICAGGDENCTTCPTDCKCSGSNCKRACCGDGVCAGENAGRCPVDCDPAFVPPARASCCGDGLCEGGEDATNCAIDCDSACANDADCDDGDACNGAEWCDVSTGACLSGTPVGCDDGDACTADRCDPATGLCTNDVMSSCCGDSVCDADENECDCPGDCGAPPATESLCTNATDDDCDGLTDCADPDCADDTACLSSSVCGNGVCEGDGEDCFSCPDDCRCSGNNCKKGCCGDGVCAFETVRNCPVDCGE